MTGAVVVSQAWRRAGRKMPPAAPSPTGRIAGYLAGAAQLSSSRGARALMDRREAQRIAEGDWWRVTLKQARPFNHRQPGIHRALLRDLRAHWPALIKSAWKPFAEKSRGAPYSTEARLALLLEVLCVWGEQRRGDTGRPQQVRAAAAELQRLDADIVRHIASLLSALRTREELLDRHLVSSRWSEPGINDAANAAELASRLFPYPQRVRSLQRVPGGLVSRRLSLADLLAAVACSEVSEPFASHADDAAALAIPRGSGYGGGAEWRTRFFEAMREAFDHDCLRWIPASGLSDLMAVGAGYAPGGRDGEFGVDNVRKQLSAFLKK